MTEINTEVPAYPEEPGDADLVSKLIWKIYFYSEEDPNGPDLGARELDETGNGNAIDPDKLPQQAPESTVSRIQQSFQAELRELDQSILLFYKFGHGGELRPVNEEVEPGSNWLGRAINVTILFAGKEPQRPIWSLNIDFSLPPEVERDPSAPFPDSESQEASKMQQAQPSPITVWRDLKRILFDRLDSVLADVVELASEGDIQGVVASSALAYFEKRGRAADPNNWGGGGPGGWPLFPMLPDNVSAPYEFTFFGDSQGIDVLRANGRTGSGVKVLILDTCPTLAAWTAAKNKWADPQDADPHPILKALAGREGNGFFMYRVGEDYAMSQSEYNRAKNSKPINYDVVDHGIFIAGIVQTIAPDAEIHLVQIMTEEGVLLINSIEDALSDFIDDMKGNGEAIIVNCSLNYELPQEEELANRVSPVKSGIETGMVGLKYSGSLDGIEALIFAAAGNEAYYQDRPPNGLKPPYPKFPSGFECVTGVSALDKNHQHAGYSNWADDFDLPPESEFPGDGTVPVPILDRMGIATLGGNASSLVYIDPTTGEPSNYGFTDAFSHLLGLYISDKFEVTLDNGVTLSIPNPQGWAYWSGTSFATAIVTAVAALVAEDMTAADPQKKPPSTAALRNKLLTYCQLPSYLREHILFTRQIPP